MEWHDWNMVQSDDRSTTGHLITHAVRPCHRLGRENSTNWSGRWLID